MGKEVDQRVVEMRFDNKQFEQNVKTSMSTLDKLKKALHLDGATKGLEDVGKAAKSVDMNLLSGAVETVRVKFSALEVMGVTALTNITNSAINAGKQLVKSLSFDQISSGYSKYEQETANVQTLMNSTGKSVDEINGYLEKLMWFSDETSYGFTDMTSALASMVSAGGDIDKLIPMIEGMATATAFAGKGATEFSRVIYNLNQSFGQGYLGLTDWKSVEIAGASSKQLKELIIETAKEVGTLDEAGRSAKDSLKAAIDISNFSTSLSDKWATSEVMEKAFSKFSEYAIAVQEAVARGDYDSTAEAMEGLAGKYDSLAVKAFEASQKAKTLTEAIDATKDAASSEWKKIFKTVLGDYEQAAELWTDISGDLWDIFVGPLEGVSDAVGGAFSSNWEKIKKQVTSAGVPVEDFKMKLIELGKKNGVVTDEMIEKAGSFEKSLKSGWLSGNLVSEALKSYTGSAKTALQATQNLESIVKKVIVGDFGNGAARVKRLTEAGYDYKTVQDLVNKTLWGQKVNYEVLSDAQLENLGFTEEQIAAFRELADEAEKTGTPLNDLIASMEKPSGRELVIDAIRNALNGLKGVVLAAQEAFTGLSSGGLYSFLKRLNELSKKLILVDNETGELNKTGQKLSKTFKGIAAIFRILGNFIKRTFNVALQLLSILFGECNTSVLDVTASIGDSIVALEEWINTNETLSTVIDTIVGVLTKSASVLHDVFSVAFSAITGDIDGAKASVYGWIDSFKKSKVCVTTVDTIRKAIEILVDVVKKAWNTVKDSSFVGFLQSVWEWLGKVVDRIGELIDKIKESEGYAKFIEVATNMWDGLKNGLSEGAKGVYGVVRKIVEGILTAAKERLGIHSPSTEFFEIGKNCLLGFIEGVLGTATDLFKIVIDTFERLIKIITEKVDMTKVLAVGAAGAVMYSFKRILDIAENVSKGFSAIGDVANSINDVLSELKNSITSLTKTLQMKAKTQVIFDIAKAIALLAASVWVLAQLDPGRLWGAIGAVAALSVVLAGLAAFMNSKWMAALGKEKIETFKKTVDVLMELAGVVVVLALVLKLLSGISGGEYDAATQGLVTIVIIVGSLIFLTNMVPEKEYAKIGTTLIAIAGAMLMLGLLLKMMSGMKDDKYDAATKGMAMIVVVVGLLIGMMRMVPEKEYAKIGTTLIAIAGAMLMLGLLLKMMSGMKDAEYDAATRGLVTLTIVVAALITLTHLAPEKEREKIGLTLLGIGGCMALLAITAKIMSTIEWSQWLNAAAGLVMLLATVAGLMLILKLAPEKDMPKISATLLAIATCMAILAGVAVILGLIPLENLAKGVVALGLLELITAALLSQAKGLDASTIAPMIVAVVMIAELCATIVILSKLPFENMIAAVLSISTLMGVCAGMMYICKNLSKDWKDVLIGIGLLTAMVAPLFVFVGALSCMSGVKNALVNAEAITLLMAASTIVVIALSILGDLAANAIPGIIALTAMIFPLLAFVGVLAEMDGLKNARNNAETLSTLAGIMTLLLIPLTVIGLVAGAAVLGALSLLVLAVPMNAFVGILSRMEGLKNAQANTEVLIILMAALEKMLIVCAVFGPLALVGEAALLGLIGIIGLFGTLVMAVGALFDTFPNLEKFIDIGIPILIKLSNGLGTVIGSFVSGLLTSALSGLPQIGTQLSQFMLNATPFIVGTKMIDESVVKSVKTLAGAFLILTGTDLLNQLTSWITGGTSLSSFGEQLAQLGPCLKNFSDSIVGVDTVAVKNAATASESLTKMLNNLPKSGGVVGFFSGENDMDTFGNQLVAFGGAMMLFSMQTIGINCDAVKAGAEAGSALATMAKDIPNIGGVVSWFTGDNDLWGFGQQIVAFGGHIKKFSEKVEGLKVESITTATKAARELSKMAKDIPNMGGVVSWFTGKNDLSTFGEKLVAFGTSIKEYGSSVSEINVDQLASVNKQVKEIIAIAKSLQSLKLDNFRSFGTTLETLAKDGIKKFKDAFSGSKDAVVNKLNEFVGNAISALKSKTNINSFKSACTTLFDSFVSGFALSKSNIVTINNVVSSAVNTIRGRYADFQAAGGYVVTGFVDGINSKNKTLSQASIKLANTTRNAIKKALKIASPSKVTTELGEYTGEGFVNGIYEYADIAGKAGSEMANSAKDGLNRAIGTMKDFVDGKISDRPTIRPVLDLSDVESGAKRIGGLLSSNQSIELASSGIVGNQNGGSGFVINMTINGAPGQDVEQLADLVSLKLNNSIQRRVNAWR